MSTRTETPKPLPVPRPSASLVVVNSRNEVLLVHRNPEARSFAGVHASSHYYFVQVWFILTTIKGVPRRELRREAGF